MLSERKRAFDEALALLDSLSVEELEQLLSLKKKNVNGASIQSAVSELRPKVVFPSSLLARSSGAGDMLSSLKPQVPAIAELFLNPASLSFGDAPTQSSAKTEPLGSLRKLELFFSSAPYSTGDAAMLSSSEKKLPGIKPK